MITDRQLAHHNNRTRFLTLAAVLELLIIVLYTMYARVHQHQDKHLNPDYYSMYQHVNVMMLIGFGFLMTFVKGHSLSALSYTFFINAIVVQLYPLLHSLWERMFLEGEHEAKVFLDEKMFILCSYSVASILIAFGAVLGKVGPFELLVMAVVGIIGYSLNEIIVNDVIACLDVGGSIAIHTFGAYFGLTVSYIISRKLNVTKKAETSQINNTFAMIGTLFLWLFWPSFNAGYFPENPFQKSLIITNTILSLTGSCLAAFIISGLYREKFSMDDILNASLAGGVAIGAPSGLLVNPGVAVLIGVIAGTVSTLGYIKLMDKLYHDYGLHDTCGINNLHGMPGILGAIFSALVIVFSGLWGGFGKQFGKQLSLTAKDRTYTSQALTQLLCSFVAIVMAVVFGAVAGMIISNFYDFRNVEFYEDKQYFEIEEEHQGHHQGNADEDSHPHKI